MDFHIIDVLELNMFALTLDDVWCAQIFKPIGVICILYLMKPWV